MLDGKPPAISSYGLLWLINVDLAPLVILTPKHYATIHHQPVTKHQNAWTPSTKYTTITIISHQSPPLLCPMPSRWSKMQLQQGHGIRQGDVVHPGWSHDWSGLWSLVNRWSRIMGVMNHNHSPGRVRDHSRYNDYITTMIQPVVFRIYLTLDPSPKMISLPLISKGMWISSCSEQLSSSIPFNTTSWGKHPGWNRRGDISLNISWSSIFPPELQCPK